MVGRAGRSQVGGHSRRVSWANRAGVRAASPPDKLTGAQMAEEFEGRDLRKAVFWGVDLRGARFRDVDMTDVTVSHASVVNVDIDALVDRLTVNGVDVTGYVNERDPWYPLRGMLRPTEPDG